MLLLKKNKAIIFSLIFIYLFSGFGLAKDVKANLEKNSTTRMTQETPENNSNWSDSQTANLWSTVKQGGAMIYILIFLGLIGLTIIIERIIFYFKNKPWQKKRIEKYLLEIVSNSKAKFREPLEEELQEAWKLKANKMERGLPLLNGLSGLAPIIGFLGTVLGMIKAFAAIAAATTVNAKVVAVGIQMALITTAGGLLVAAPLLAAFHFFNHLFLNMNATAEEFISSQIKELPSFMDEDA